MVTLEENVVGGVGVAAVQTRSVVVGSRAEVGGICGFECMSGDELESGGLVQMGVGGKNSADEVGDGEAGWFPEWGKIATGVSGGRGSLSTSPFFLQAL